MTKLMTDVSNALLDRLEVPGDGIAAAADLIEQKEYGTMFGALVESVLEDKRQAVKEARRKMESSTRKLKQLGGSPDIIAAGFGLLLEEYRRALSARRIGPGNGPCADLQYGLNI
ncbi:MAG: hypothetical protein LBP81_03415 [Treponema sp.]|jgi:hypothetical protein|nr:hypothetical protein [Treponema sp.]